MLCQQNNSMCTGRAEQEDSTWRLDADSLEELRVAQRELDHLLDLRELLAAATDIVVANLVELLLLFLDAHPGVEFEHQPSLTIHLLYFAHGE